MVAHTMPDCLPYLTATDPLCVNTGTVCEPSTVWCDAAEIVEARLDEFDGTVGRASDSVPMAWVETTTPFIYVIGDPTLAIPFDTVRVDTDNMVNLDENPSAINITRSGLYLVVAYLTGIFDSVGSTGSVALMTGFVPYLTNVMGPYTPTEFRADSATPFDLETVSAKVQGVAALQAGQDVVGTIVGSGAAPDTFAFSRVMMAVSWVGDLP